jgi:hypothetical protein
LLHFLLVEGGAEACSAVDLSEEVHSAVDRLEEALSVGVLFALILDFPDLDSSPYFDLAALSSLNQEDSGPSSAMEVYSFPSFHSGRLEASPSVLTRAVVLQALDHWI